MGHKLGHTKIILSDMVNWIWIRVILNTLCMNSELIIRKNEPRNTELDVRNVLFSWWNTQDQLMALSCKEQHEKTNPGDVVMNYLLQAQLSLAQYMVMPCGVYFLEIRKCKVYHWIKLSWKTMVFAAPMATCPPPLPRVIFSKPFF